MFIRDVDALVPPRNPAGDTPVPQSGGRKLGGSDQSCGDIGRVELLPWPFHPAVTLNFKCMCAYLFGIPSW